LVIIIVKASNIIWYALEAYICTCIYSVQGVSLKLKGFTLNEFR
jgi:hypothetical protein